jgi:hypothetical protein
LGDVRFLLKADTKKCRLRGFQFKVGQPLNWLMLRNCSNTDELAQPALDFAPNRVAGMVERQNHRSHVIRWPSAIINCIRALAKYLEPFDDSRETSGFELNMKPKRKFAALIVPGVN